MSSAGVVASNISSGGVHCLGVVNLHTVSRLREASDNQLSEPLTVFNDQQPHLSPDPAEIPELQTFAVSKPPLALAGTASILSPTGSSARMKRNTNSAPPAGRSSYAYGRPMGFNDAANNRQSLPSR